MKIFLKTVFSILLLQSFFPFCSGLSDDKYLNEIIHAKPWSKYTSGKIHLYCFSGSEAEKDKDIILSKRNQALKSIEDFFGRKTIKPVHVFFYPSSEAAEGYSCYTAWPSSSAYFNLYQTGKWSYEKHHYGHEITHIFSNMDDDFRNKVYPIGLIDEGIAEYLSGFSVDPHRRLTQHWQAHGIKKDYISIQKENLAYNSPSLYQIAGSFAAFLIENHIKGKEKFLSLLKKTGRPEKSTPADFDNFKAAIEKIYSISFDEMIRRWNKALKPYWNKKYTISKIDCFNIQNALKKRKYGKIKQIHYNAFGKFISLSISTTTHDNLFVQATQDEQWVIK